MSSKTAAYGILQIGHPLLTKRSNPIQATQVKSKTNQKIIDVMISSIEKYEGVGLAAPQLGILKRIIIIQNSPDSKTKRKSKKDEFFPLEVLVNPIITDVSDDTELDWEGCLSINNGNLLGLVPRHKIIHIEYFNKDGNRKKTKIKGFKARVIQHEVDHLDGVLFFERMKKRNMSSLTTRENWEEYNRSENDN